jgi:hypothetical protein
MTPPARPPASTLAAAGNEQRLISGRGAYAGAQLEAGGTGSPEPIPEAT